MMSNFFSWLKRMRALRASRIIRVSGVQPLAGGVTVYAIDVDERRIIVGASPHAVSVLDRYPYKSERRADRGGSGCGVRLSQEQP